MAAENIKIQTTFFSNLDERGIRARRAITVFVSLEGSRFFQTRQRICGRWRLRDTYGDIDMLALMAFKERRFDGYFSRVARRFPVMIVDEC